MVSKPFLSSVVQTYSSNARYLGSLVADVHNVLTNGGIYGYPATTNNPKGKLRLLYESAPMAMILEQAGGAGSTGHHGRILDVVPKSVHERYVLHLGENTIRNCYIQSSIHSQLTSFRSC